MEAYRENEMIRNKEGMELNKRNHTKSRDRRDIGEVVFLSEKMEAARQISSCCVGVEATLETNNGLSNLVRKLLKGSNRSQENQ